MDKEQLKQFYREQKQKGLLPKGEDLKLYYRVIEGLYNANLTNEELVNILRNINAKFAHDILFSYRLRSGSESFDANEMLHQIYLQEYIEDYNNNNIDKRLTLRTTKKRPRVITREEVMYILFQKGVTPSVIFFGYNGKDELVKSLVETGKTVFERRKTESIYKRIEASLIDDMNYVIAEVEKVNSKTL